MDARPLSMVRWLLLAGCMAAAPSLPAASFTVTTTADAASRVDTPPPGSLREALALANAGDTIDFAVSGRVRLNDLLAIDSRLTGLTIQGQATISSRRGLISVRAGGVNLRSLRIENTRVNVIGNSGGPVAGFTLEDSTLVGASSLSLVWVDDCRIQGNTFTTRSRETPIDLGFTRNCVIEQNHVFGSARRSSLADDLSENLRITGNEFAGGVTSNLLSGLIEDNDFNGSRGLQVNPFDGRASEPVTVQRNRAAFMRVQRTNVTIVDNDLMGSAVGRRQALLTVVNGEPLGPAGPVVVENNRVTGGNVGLQYSEAVRGADTGTIKDNKVTACSRVGILVNGATRLTVRGNEAWDCGGGRYSAGLQLRRLGGDRVVAVANVLHDIKGSGIDVIALRDVVHLEGNTIRDNEAAGIDIYRGMGSVLADDNTIENNQGPGVAVRAGALAEVVGGTIRSNGDAGVLIGANARVLVSGVSFRENAGPGIDILTKGVTPNEEPKLANKDLDWPEMLRIDPDTKKLEGVTAPHALVEVFVVETGLRTGNPENGEGETFLGQVQADDAGHFVFPPAGAIECPPTELITVTATLPGDAPVTSEFSPDFHCVIPEPRVDVRLPKSTVHCPASSCDVRRDEAGEPDKVVCEDCEVENDDGTRYACDEGETCVAETDQTRCEGCDVYTGDAAIDCGGEARCWSGMEDELIGCQGGPGDCGIGGAGFDEPGCGATPCIHYAAKGFPLEGAGRITVQKITTDGNDGVFPFDIAQADGSRPVNERIPTNGGAGVREIVYWLNAVKANGPATVSVTGVVPAGWELLGVELNGEETGQAPGEPGRVDLDVTGSERLTLTFVDRYNGPVLEQPLFGATVRCNAYEDCAFEACRYCTLQSERGPVADCTDGESLCGVNQEGDLACEGCYLREDDAGVATDCEGGRCGLDWKGALFCDGGWDSCGAVSDALPPAPCPVAGGCRLLRLTTDSPVFTEPSRLVISKRTVGGDGSFIFDIQPSSFDGITTTTAHDLPTITTAGGKGLKTLDLRYGGVCIEVSEQATAGFAVESIACDSDAASFGPAADGSGATALDTCGGTGEALFGAEYRCEFANVRSDAVPAMTVRDLGLDTPEAANGVGSFGLPPSDYLAVAGLDKVRVIDAFTGEAANPGLFPLEVFIAPGSAYGAVVVKDLGGPGADALAWHGPYGTAVSVFDPTFKTFGFTQIASFTNTPHAAYLGGDPESHTVLFTDNGNSRVFVLSSDALSFAVEASQLAGASGSAVAAYADTIDGPVVVLTDGAPGQIHLADPTNASAPAILVGDAGDAPRDLRCVAGLCIAVNYLGDSITVMTWDGGENAEIKDEITVGDGPVGGDLIETADGAAAVTTGFDSNTFTVNLLGRDGSELASRTFSAPVECVSPGHARWLHGRADTFVATCNGSSNMVVVERAIEATSQMRVPARMVAPARALRVQENRHRRAR